jgi:putative copper export protein
VTALAVVHLLAACVWVGGTVALVFAGVPTLRSLPDVQRAASVRTLGRRWKPIGWGSLLVLGGTGAGLAFGYWNAGDPDVLFRSEPGREILAKMVLFAVMLTTAALHDFVLGPRLNRQIRDGRRRTLLRPMQAVGWATFALTIALPVLGVLVGR